MKIVTWNCRESFAKKFHLLDTFDADICVVQECENPEMVGGKYQEWAKNSLWIKRTEIQAREKGLGIFAKAAIKLTKLNWIDNQFQLFLPCRINDDFNLIAVWTQLAKPQRLSYVSQLWNYLQSHKAQLKSAPTLICGDFNSNKQFDGKYSYSQHSLVVRDLESIDIHSIYHKATGEEQGNESLPTFFHDKALTKSHHIDHAFASAILFDKGSRVEIGEPGKWRGHSDHMPLSFTVRA